MTQNRRRSIAIRKRMAETGEFYAEAARKHDEERLSKLTQIDEEVEERDE